MRPFKTLAQGLRLNALFDAIGTAVRRKPRHGRYADVSLTDADINEGRFKVHLGGGAGAWTSRGAFQLHFLQGVGLRPYSKVLDVGCGPGRAAAHLVPFLQDSGYRGVDYNPDFVRAAHTMSASTGLDAKSPIFETIRNFDFDHIDAVYDFAIVFSVLNHCNAQEKRTFFRNIAKPLQTGGRAYISHARWLHRSYVRCTSMELTNTFTWSTYDIRQFGWKSRKEIFPIVELTKR